MVLKLGLRFVGGKFAAVESAVLGAWLVVGLRMHHSHLGLLVWWLMVWDGLELS